MKLGELFFFACVMFILIDLGHTISRSGYGKSWCEGTVLRDLKQGAFGQAEAFSGFYSREEIAGFDHSRILSMTCGDKPK